MKGSRERGEAAPSSWRGQLGFTQQVERFGLSPSLPTLPPPPHWHSRLSPLLEETPASSCWPLITSLLVAVAVRLLNENIGTGVHGAKVVLWHWSLCQKAGNLLKTAGGSAVRNYHKMCVCVCVCVCGCARARALYMHSTATHRGNLCFSMRLALR